MAVHCWGEKARLQTKNSERKESACDVAAEPRVVQKRIWNPESNIELWSTLSTSILSSSYMLASSTTAEVNSHDDTLITKVTGGR